MESPSSLRICVPDCHNTLNRILRRALKATITLKEAEIAVLKRDKLRSAIEEIHTQDANVVCYVYLHIKITPSLTAVVSHNLHLHQVVSVQITIALI